MADRLEQNLELIATAETIDNGKPIRETINADIPLAIDHFRYFAGCLRAQEGSLSELDETTVAYHFHEPLGVIGQIIPWNFPILMAAWKLAPAIAAGNCVEMCIRDRCKIMMNVGNPDMAFGFAKTPNDGVGLARLEFVINNMVGIHPKAILNAEAMPTAIKTIIQNRARGYASPKQFYIDKVAEGVATIAAAFYPKPVIVRTSDFKSNEYKKLVGGEIYEPDEENPMIGFRGAARYMAEDFKECFAMECAAMKKVRDEMGLTNVELMLPFVRTIDEAKAVTDIMAANGLKRGQNGLRLIMMCEIPSNALLAEEFLHLSLIHI